VPRAFERRAGVDPAECHSVAFDPFRTTCAQSGQRYGTPAESQGRVVTRVPRSRGTTFLGVNRAPRVAACVHP
jgi:hypothetical protein